MKFTLDVKASNETLTGFDKILKSPEYMLMEAAKDGVFVIGTNNGRTLKMRLSGTAATFGTAGVPLTILKGVLKNRQSLDFATSKVSKGKLAFSGKNYSGDISVVPMDDIEIQKSDGKALRFTSELLRVFNHLLSKTTVSPIYVSEDLPTHVSMGKYLEVCCYDNFHVAYAKAKHSFKSQHSISLPADTFTVINQAAKGSGYSLTIAESSIYATSKEFNLVLPTQQIENTQGIPMIQQYMGDTKKAKVVMKVTVSTQSLIKVIQNVQGMHESGTGVEFLASAKGLSIWINSSYGKMKDVVKASAAVSNKKPIKCDPNTLMDLLANVSEKEVVLCATDRSLYFELKSEDIYRFYACGLI